MLFRSSIGTSAGYTNQGAYSIAIGCLAGSSNQGANSIAIGYQAGSSTATTSTIILNASGTALNAPTINSFYVKPIRATTSTNILYYNTLTSEVGYGPSVEGAGSGTTATWATLLDKVGDLGPTEIVLGQGAGQTNVGSGSVFIGQETGLTALVGQDYRVAIGFQSGMTNQSGSAIAIGPDAGNNEIGRAHV